MATIQSEHHDGELRITLPSELDIEAAELFRELLLAPPSGELTVRVDSSAVDRLSTAFAQTLVAGVRHLGGRDARFVLADPSDALIEGISDLGLYSELMTWTIE